jgi:hypothetical protein
MFLLKLLGADGLKGILTGTPGKKRRYENIIAGSGK